MAHMSRRRVVVMLGLLLVVVVALAAIHQTTQPGATCRPTVATSAASGPVGVPIVLSGSCWGSSQLVDLRITRPGPAQLIGGGEARSSASGTLAATMSLPAASAPGVLSISATESGHGIAASTTYRVLAPSR